MSSKTRAITSYWKTQLPVDYLDTTLVQNTWENVSADLSEGMPARLWYIIVEQTNNAASAEDLELEITINGTAYTASLGAIASGALNFVAVSAVLTAGDFTLTDATSDMTAMTATVNTEKSIPFIAESVGLIRVRQTSDVDVTSAQIEVTIVWDKLTRIS